jgi:bacterioferritin-associated ferredoxin
MANKVVTLLRDAIPAPWVIYVALGMIVAAAYTGWSVRGWRCDAAKTTALVKAAKTTDRMARVVSDTAVKYETQKEISYATREVRINTIREVYRDVPVATDCAPLPAAQRLLADAVASANAAASGQSGSELPRPAPTP